MVKTGRAAVPRNALRLADRGRRDVVPHRLRPQLLEPDGEDAVHAAEVEDALAFGRIAAEQHPLPPLEVGEPPVEILSARGPCCSTQVR